MIFLLLFLFSTIVHCKLPLTIRRGVEVWPFAFTPVQKQIDRFATLSQWNADSISLSVFLTVAHQNSSVVGRAAKYSLTDNTIVQYVTAAQKLNIEVMLRVFFAVEDGSKFALIDPIDADMWFSTYKNHLIDLATLAQTHKIKAIVIASEIPKIASNPKYKQHWQNVIVAVRKVFRGELTYAALPTIELKPNSPMHFWQNVTFWNDLDWIGIDAYFSVANQTEPIPPVGVVEARWSGWLDYIAKWRRAAQLTHKPIVFAEVGFQSSVNCLIQPWLYPPYPPVGSCTGMWQASNECQEVGFKALFAALSARHDDMVRGVFIQWLTQPDSPFNAMKPEGVLHPCDFSPVGKPAFLEIARAFKQ